MEVFVLRKGSNLYRSPRIETEKHIWGNYFSRTDLACVYSRETENNLYTFKTKKTLRFIDFSNINTFVFLYKTLEGKDLELFKIVTGFGIKELTLKEDDTMLCYYKNKPLFEPLFCIIGYMDQEDDEDEYLNKKFAKMLYKFGYDGVRIPGKYKFMSPRKIKFYEHILGYNPQIAFQYEQDFFLYNPKDSVEINKIEEFSKSKLCKHMRNT